MEAPAAKQVGFYEASRLVKAESVNEMCKFSSLTKYCSAHSCHMQSALCMLWELIIQMTGLIWLPSLSCNCHDESRRADNLFITACLM